MRPDLKLVKEPKPGLDMPTLTQMILYRLDGGLEMCGYVLADWSVVVVHNISPTPDKSFLFDKEQQRSIVESLRPKIIGVFHTHPSGNPEPSEADIAGWPKVPGFRYWIVAGGEIVEWQKDGKTGSVKRIWRSFWKSSE